MKKNKIDQTEYKAKMSFEIEFTHWILNIEN